MMRLFLIGLLFLLFGACSDSESTASSNSNSETVPEGFVHLTAPQKNVFLGTNSDSAQVLDYPQMKVVLDYDFYIARNGVSCQEYSQLMNTPADALCDASGVVTSISFFDAVLYANARSKAEKRDTAYSYTKIVRDSKGSCISLVGMRLNTDVDGYRIPTEAEWVYAFKELYHPDSSNSGYSIHVKEWVNDWLGLLKDTTITNFMGAPNGDGLDRHVLKGGDYSTDNFDVNSYNRGDIYPVSSSTRSYYVGFRLVYGKIPNPIWLTSMGKSQEASTVVLVSPRDIFEKLRSYRVKLAFRDNMSGNLQFIDFYNGRPRLVGIEDSLGVNHPEISPDGQWVVYSTGMEGITGKSKIIVRRLVENSVLPVELDVESATIPRFRVTESGDTVVVYVTDGGNNEDDGDFFARSTWQVPFSKGHFGTPEKLFNGAYHGGISPNHRLAVTGARKLRARIADGKNGTVYESQALDTMWYNKEQACNASLAQDGSNRTLFLDFGSDSTVGAKFVGHKYGVHEQILIVDSTGRLVQAIPAPQKYSFDHTEWVGETGFIIATLTNSSGNHEKVVLINPSDSSIVDVVSGTDLYHPCLWMDDGLKNVKFDKTLNADSAGLYISDNFLQEDLFWRYKMELLWKMKDSADMVILGSSRPFNGLRPRVLTSAKVVVNLAQTPNSIFTSRDFLKYYILPHVKKLKYLVVSLDLDFWWKSDNDIHNFFKGTYKNYIGFVYDEKHEFWRDGYPNGLYELTANAPGIEGGQEAYTKENGYMLETCTDWGSDDPSVVTDTTLSTDSLMMKLSFEALEEIVNMASERGVVVIGAIFPMSPAYKKTGAFGRHGMRRSLAARMIEQIKDLQSDYFILFDENKMGDHDYSSSMFSNYDHLCVGGAKKFTSRLDSLIASLE